MNEYKNFIGGTHVVKISFQFEDYKGYLVHEIGGNCFGKNILDYDLSLVFEDDQLKENACDLQNYGDTELYRITLMNQKGDAYEIDGDSDEIAKYVVAVEIIDFIPNIKL